MLLNLLSIISPFFLLGAGLVTMIGLNLRNINKIKDDVRIKGFEVESVSRQWIRFMSLEDRILERGRRGYFNIDSADYDVVCLDRHGTRLYSKARISYEFLVVPRSIQWTPPLIQGDVLISKAPPEQKRVRMLQMEAEGLHKKNEELKRQIRILKDQNQRFEKELNGS